MIARTYQEQFDAVFVVWSHLTSGGVRRYWSQQVLSLADKFAQSLLLASSEDQVLRLIRAHPKRAGAFLEMLNEVKQELEREGVGIAAVPDSPLLLYSPAAEVVSEAVCAARKKMPYLHHLASTSSPTKPKGRP
jgi:hypothetical protein